jgi:hypothetical protein
MLGMHPSELENAEIEDFIECLRSLNAESYDNQIMKDHRTTLIQQGMNREQDLSNQLYVITLDRNQWRSCCIATMIAMGLQMLLYFFG